MAVFTPVTLDDLAVWLPRFSLGQAYAVTGIKSGIENSNFFLTTESGKYVLTIFEKLTFAQLPFYLNLMSHLAARHIPVPVPLPDAQGNLLHSLHGKPAAIVTCLEGASETQPTSSHCAFIGAMLGKMHLAGRDFPLYQTNLRGIEWWNSITPQVLAYLSPADQVLLKTELALQTKFFSSRAYRELPSGLVHADLFRDNVMFKQEQLTGIFDFYFAGYDAWLFDVAIAVNDWCVIAETGAFDPARLQAFLHAYHIERAFTQNEAQVWQTMLRAAALRFWLSRLYDFFLPRHASMLASHDPDYFKKILKQRLSTSIPPLY